MFKILTLTMLLFFSLNSIGADRPTYCFRPQDMSNAKAVKNYVTCVNKNKKLCVNSSKAKECAATLKPLDYLTRFPSNIEDINPADRCKVYRDGSYKCIQDPIRFVAKEREIPVTLPSQTPENSGSDAGTPANSSPAAGITNPSPANNK